jgi:hypothetical protein
MQLRLIITVRDIGMPIYTRIAGLYDRDEVTYPYYTRVYIDVFIPRRLDRKVDDDHGMTVIRLLPTRLSRGVL